MNNPKPAKILITDDDGLVRDAVAKILEMFGHEVSPTGSGEEALEVLTEDFDLIILDINMPGMDGFDTIKAINERGYDIPVLFLTGAGSMEYAIKAINLGAYDFIQKPIEDIDLFNVKINRAIEKRMFVLKEKAYTENLEEEIAAKTRELAEKNKLLEQYSHHLEVASVNTIITLQTALEEKDQYTAGHTNRVTHYAMLIGRSMGLPEEDLAVLDRACQLHDVGKLVIDVSCIQKPGPLSDEEWQLVRKHPEIGENIIKPLSFLEREGTIVRHHHERIDGKGYPDGIGGDELDILTRILTVADSYDAMTSQRSYRIDLARAEAIDELRSCTGSQFDPEVVEHFIEILEEDTTLARNSMKELQENGYSGILAS
ncbi:MAG: response regulator [Desulfuromonadales bacterium]|nr:response regulator [Desulfuromonadales bacterium]